MDTTRRSLEQATVESLLEEQWHALLAWLRAVNVQSRADEPTGLDGWAVGDLVAHLGYGIAMVVEVEAAPAGTSPISLGEYVGGYRAAAATIEEQTRRLRRELEPDLVAGITRMAGTAWARLDQVQPAVVLGRRGPLRLGDYLMTRLIEVVVHAHDLERALGRIPGPEGALLPDAVGAVATALADVHLEVYGARPDAANSLEWVRQASGRAPAPEGLRALLG